MEDHPKRVVIRTDKESRKIMTVKEKILTEKDLDRAIADHLAALNKFDLDGMVAPFAEDAFVNDARREFRGIEAIRAWADREMIGDRVTIEVREIVDNYGDTIVRGAYDGDYDKSKLPPGELIMSNYYGVRDGKITSLIIIRNEPAVIR
jgi:hypothetical protein